jgi:ABC-2 type transport system ATP-binding protein
MAVDSQTGLNQPQQAPIGAPVISVKNLTKTFGDEAVVQDVTFDVPQASIFGFIGPSGSGKTTTVRMLTGVIKPTSGEVTVLARNPAKFSQRRRARLGYMPQLFALFPNLTVWENLNFAASLYGMSLFRNNRLRKTLEFVELYQHRNKLARDISGGMLRRLSLAATLVHDPDLLLLDEPTAGIDPILRAKFWEHFKQLQSRGNTLFITTQYVSEADECDLVGVMSSGKLLLVDTPHGLRQHAYGGDIVELETVEPLSFETESALRMLPFVRERTTRTGANSMRIIVDEASTAIPELMRFAQQVNSQVKSIEEYNPPFEDVFVELVHPQAEVRNG